MMEPTAGSANTLIMLANLLGVVFSGISMAVVIGLAFKLGSWFATVNAQLENLKSLPDRVSKLEQRAGVIETDVHNLWRAFRDYMKANADDENKYLKFLREWDERNQVGKGDIL